MICNNRKILFIHIPGTGGTSLEIAFRPWRGNNLTKHETLSNAMEKNPKAKDYFKFSIVRNPWSLCVSMFHKQSKITNFKNFLNQEKPFCFVPWHEHLMSDYLLGDLDFVCRFENLQHDFNIICDKIGIKHQELPHENKSNTKHYSDFYDDESREIVAKKYAKDIEHFNYSFE